MNPASVSGFAPLATPGSIPPGAVPGKGLRITGGVLTILLGALLVISGALIVTIGAHWFANLGGSEIIIAGAIAMGVGALGVLFGSLSCAGKTAGAIGGGVLMSVLSALSLLALAGEFRPIILGEAVFAIAAAVFSFLGIGQCKAWGAYRRAGGR